MISIAISGIIVALSVVLFLFSLKWIFEEYTLAFISGIISVIVCMAMTALGAFGKIGDVMIISGVESGALLHESVTTLIDASLVYIYGFVGVAMAIIIIYTLVQYLAVVAAEQKTEQEEEE